jgi:hypothetical protein
VCFLVEGISIFIVPVLLRMGEGVCFGLPVFLGVVTQSTVSLLVLCYLSAGFLLLLTIKSNAAVAMSLAVFLASSWS